MASCIIVTAIICILITTVAIIISFATPNWVRFEHHDTGLCGCATCDCGMWLSCNGRFLSDGTIDNCRWFFSRDFEVEKNLPVWFKAVQGLMSCAVLTSILSLVVGLFSLCCYCKSCNPHRAAGTFISLTFLLVAVAVCLFGAKGHIDYNVEVMADEDLELPVAIFSWSFWVAVGAGVMALVTSSLYFCVGGSSDEDYV